jgi:vacuolar-type H+-ATPase subunit H
VHARFHADEAVNVSYDIGGNLEYPPGATLRKRAGPIRSRHSGTAEIAVPVFATYDLSYGRYRLGAAVNEILVILSAATGVLVVGWLLVIGSGFLSRRRVRRSAERQSKSVDLKTRDEDWIYADRAAPQLRTQRVTESPSEATHEAETVLRDARLEAAEILAQAEKERESLVEEKLAAAERAAREIRYRAEREAEGIVKNAELKAGEALVGVERARGRLEQELQELARDQARMAEKHRRLSEFLIAALEEIERASANGSANIGGLQELRDKLRSIE